MAGSLVMYVRIVFTVTFSAFKNFTRPFSFMKYFNASWITCAHIASP